MRRFTLILLACVFAPYCEAVELTKEQILEDIEWLDEAIVDRYAYFPLKTAEHEGIFAGIRQDATPATTSEELGRVLVRWLARYGDGHLTIKHRVQYLEPGRAPSIFAPTENGRIVALRTDRSDFLDAAHPFVQAIDGVEISSWLSEILKRVCSGHDRYTFRHAVQRLQYVNEVRSYLGKPKGETVTLKLVNARGTSTTTQVLTLVTNFPEYVPWPVRKSEVLDGNIGYLRLSEMDDSVEFSQSLRESMASFRDTSGLVIDVRGNSGGDRNPLLTLFPYFLSPEASPVAVYVAAQSYPKDWDGEEPGETLKRWKAYPSGYSGWNDREQTAINTLAFSPELNLSTERFSPLHFTVLGRSEESLCYYYDKPVALLIDEYCFSATDVFAGAFALLPQVTLVGSRTGGGAGIVDSFELPQSGIEVWIPKTVGLRPDGKLYNGRGIAPDIDVTPTPRFWLKDGEDPALDRALRELGVL